MTGLLIGTGIYITGMHGGGVIPSFATTEWQLITHQWQTIITTWN